MSDHNRPAPPPDDDPGERPADPPSRAAADGILDGGGGLPAEHLRVEALERRSRRLAIVSGVAVLTVVLLAGLLVAAIRRDPGGPTGRSSHADVPSAADVDAMIADLPAEPVDPTRVKLLRTVSTFDSCPALIEDLRRVGAEHVGSRGFGGDRWGPPRPWAIEESAAESAADDSVMVSPAGGSAGEAATSGSDGDGGGETLGTNVQVAGIDEPDHVKTEGRHIHDLGPGGDLRITDGRTGEIVGTVSVVPNEDSRVDSLLVQDGRVAVFGTEIETSEPIEGDPSATRVTTSYLTIALVDATDPENPVLTERARIDGSLVAARLVDDEIRLVSTSHLADIGFVMPTTGNSVGIALEANRRAVASSTITDWIPNWTVDGGDPTPLVPCERVHVPDTFAGVAMTSMVTFPITADGFQPTGTGILAPGDTVYAGVDRVAVSAGIWVDPIDRERLRFDDWRTAVHEFAFDETGAPTHVGSGIVDGSLRDQFAFGEVGDDLAVVTSAGTPWGLRPTGRIELTVMARSGDAALEPIASVDDLSGGRGAVTAIRFLDDRVLVATGHDDGGIRVLDVSDHADPRAAGRLGIDGDVEHIHPIGGGRALVFTSEWVPIEAGSGLGDRIRADVHLVDVSDPDDPRLLDTWTREGVAGSLGWDHHGLTWWAERDLALWGLEDVRWDESPRQNHAAVLRAADTIEETAMVAVSDPPKGEPNCPELPVDAGIGEMLGDDARIIRCDDPDARIATWSGFACSWVDPEIVEQYAPGESSDGSIFVCHPAGPPTVGRVLVVEGTPILHTDQTLEILDPDTFESVTVIGRATGNGSVMW